MRIPPPLAEEWTHEPEWLADLPRLVAECAEQWKLVLEEPVDTPHSLVIPADEVVLKLNAPSHYEADQEPDALALWAGAGAVQLLARDDAKRAFLCERCRPGTRLWDAKVDERDVVVPLLSRLSVEVDSTHPFRRLADEADRWAGELPARYELGGRVFERPLLDYALDVLGSVDRSAGFLANQDLHGGNILSAHREPWLVIDPKPLVGERALDGVGLLRNAAFGGDPIEHWLDVLAELGLDRQRLRGWGVAHALAWGWEPAGRWSMRSVEAARAILAA